MLFFPCFVFTNAYTGNCINISLYSFLRNEKGPAAMYHAMQQQQQQQIQKLRGLIAVPVSPPMPMHHALQQQQQQKPTFYLTGKFQVPNGITRAPPQHFMPVKTTMEPHGQGQGFSNIKVRM